MSSSAIEKKVLDLIDKSRDDNIALMQKLVQIPSYTGEEGEMGEFLVKEVAKFGLKDSRIVQELTGRPNVMANYNGKTGKPSLTVYGHYDTVPSGDITKWTYGPFSGQIVDGKIYGRGVKDHKYPIPPLLFAIKAIKDASVTLNGNIVFAFVGDEEFGGGRGMGYVVEKGHCDTDYLLYSGGGGDGKTIGLASNGRRYFRIIVKGETMHTGRNDRGVNAILEAMKILPHLAELREEVNNRKIKFKAGDAEILGQARFSINKIHAFTTGNNVPDICEIQIDRRLIPQHETYESGQAEIQEVLDKVKKEHPDLDAELFIVPDRDMLSSVSVPDSPLFKSLQRSAEKVLGVKPTVNPGPTGGSSDHGWWIAKYPNRAFCSYGCSRGSGSHTYDEYISIDALIENTKIYALLMMDLLGVA